MLSVCLGGFVGVIRCVQMVGLGRVRVMRGSFVSAGVVICDPTIEGTCIRDPALTRRTSTVPVAEIPVVTGVVTGGVPEVVVPAVAANNELSGVVRLNPTPLIV